MNHSAPSRGLAVAALCLSLAAPVRAAEPRVTFANSARELPAAQKATLHAMTAARLADRVGFNVPLALRNREELGERVSRGEVLSGAELREKYFPLQADYDAIAAWLRSEGFTVDPVADTNLAVFAHGTVAQVRASFQTDMGLVTANGAERAVALSAPSLPARLAGPALGVSGLSYRRPQSRLAFPTAGNATGARAVPSGGYHINQIKAAYGGTNLSVNGTTLTGAGQTIAVEAYVQVNNADLTTFWTANGVTRTGTVTTINVNGATLATDASNVEENALDVEWASGIAPGANIVDYATSYDNNDSPERIYNRVITDASASGSTVHQLSSSYGPSESQLTTAELSAYNQIFLSLTAAGCTYLNATGDVGVYPVEAYGVFPYTLGVGGTNLQVNATTFARTAETGWTGSSGGVSANYAHPAWQVGTGTDSSLKRQFPDLSLAADPATPAYYVYTTTTQHISTVGGTSWSAPTFAGFLALIHQGRALNTPARGVLGFLNPRVYALNLTSNFFDVTSGNNTTDPHTGYNATTGYDMVTGVGVPTFSTFLATLLGPTITSFTPASGATGTSVVITGTNFYAGPTAALSVSFGGVASASVTVDSPTQVTATVPARATTGAVAVRSFGDGATSGTNFTVIAPDLTVTCAHTGNFTYHDTGDTYTITVTNNGAAPTSGTVSVVDTLPNGALTATNLTGTGWTIAGSFLSATRTDALAAGGSYPPLTLTVSVPGSPQTTTNQVNVSGGGETNTSNDIAQDSTTIAGQTPSQSWRYQYFGTNANAGNAADTANPAGDGINNITKYALNLDPTKPVLSTIVEDTTTGYLRLTVTKNPNATDVTYAVQVTGDPTVPTTWTANDTFTMQNSSTTLQVRDTTAVNSAVKRFIRLQVSR